jgi:hypothetical protein
MALDIFKYIAGVATILTGVVSLFWPMKVPGFTGLDPNGGRGVSEIRTILGALFVGLGGAVLYLNNPDGYLVLGITYLAMALVRGISIFVDNSMVSSNIISFFVELIFGIILVL